MQIPKRIEKSHDIEKVPRSKFVADVGVSRNSQGDASSVFGSTSGFVSAKFDGVDVTGLFAVELLDDENAFGVVAVAVERVTVGHRGSRVRQPIGVQKGPFEKLIS